MVLNIRHLRYFKAVVEAGSFSRAASMIRVAQPALSRQVVELERIVGVELLARIARGVEPTDAGKALYRETVSILRRIEHLPEIARSVGGDVEGVVILGLSSTLASFLAGPFMDACRTAYPRIKLRLVTADSMLLRSRIDAGHLDLAVLYEDEPTPGFTRELLYRQRLYLVDLAGDPPSDDGGTIALARLAELPLVLPIYPNVTRMLMDRAFAEAGIVPDVVAEADVFGSLLAAVQSGLGHTILPRGDLADVPGNEKLRLRSIEPALHLTASIISSDDAALSPAAAVIRSLLVEFIFELIKLSPPPGAEWIGRQAIHAPPA